ncbi:MAG TPA: MbcA/ParS/Xre antitoxin family protein [Thermoanaerobaculia bacterium]|jgi:putative toxin-antitoxin system antitoxin component (TIGR02293 family)|nr:MbcA/ParS/Xre antitoxin family protein [Thermoanaerobaculia bacterium]
MREDLFASFIASVEEGAKISRGRIEPARRDDLLARVLELFDGDASAARQWLLSPQPVLGGAIPLEMAAAADDAREVEAAIGRLEHGVFS